jgi:hypothetical protein
MLHAAALIAATTATGAIAKPVRSMVYSFTYSTPREQHQGTILADVLGVTQDGGLVIRFSQNVAGQPAQTFAPAECSVYGDTRVQCQKPGALGTFENEIAHLLGRNFVDANSMDEKNHWRVAGTLDGANVTDDFTVTSNDAGILNINEVRDVTVQGSTTHHTAKITYDLNKTVPTKVQYTDANSAQPALAVTVDYALKSDWMVPKATPKP